MFKFESMIRRGAAEAGRPRSILAAPFDLPEMLCERLIAEGVIAGCLAQNAPSLQEDLDTQRIRAAGWWVSRKPRQWFIRPAGYDSVLLLCGNGRVEPSGYMVMEAFLKGIRDIHLVDISGAVIKRINVFHTVADRVLSFPDALRMGSYKDAFEEGVQVLANHFSAASVNFSPRRVLHIVGGLGPGGAERQVAYTAAGLAKKGYEVIIGCSSLEPPNNMFRPMVEHEGVTVLEYPRDNSFFAAHGEGLYARFEKYLELDFWNILHEIYYYAAFIASVRPQIVHTWMDYSNVLAGLAAAIVGVPTLVLSGRSGAPDNFPNLFQPYMRPGYEVLLAQRDAFIMNNSRFGAVDYGRFLGVEASRIHVVNNGFVFPRENSMESRNAVRREHGIPEDAFVVGTIMRFSEEKQPKLFVDLARRVHERFPGVYFLAFGIGPLLDQIRSDVRAVGLSPFVKLPGLTTDAWASLSAMDVFVLTSRVEGLANVLIEAQGSGLPIVCTGAGGMPETFLEGQTGFGITDATPEALAGAVCRLIEDPIMRERMSDTARRHARESFSVEKMIAHTVEAYEAAESMSSSARDNARSEPLPH